MAIDNSDSSVVQVNCGSESILSVEEKKYLKIVYVLFAIGLFFGILFLAGAMLAHIKRGDAHSAIAAEHYRFQIRTFWFSLPWLIVGIISSWLVIGYFILAGVGLWILWRVLKGWIRLSDERGVYSN